VLRDLSGVIRNLPPNLRLEHIVSLQRISGNRRVQCDGPPAGGGNSTPIPRLPDADIANI
jgi:hypothetical protein